MQFQIIEPDQIRGWGANRSYLAHQNGSKVLMIPIAGMFSVKLRLSFGYASVTLRLSHSGKVG
jgi:hypothetical protein